LGATATFFTGAGAAFLAITFFIISFLGAVFAFGAAFFGVAALTFLAAGFAFAFTGVAFLAFAVGFAFAAFLGALADVFFFAMVLFFPPFGKRFAKLSGCPLKQKILEKIPTD
jgi:hypothetical protein